MKRELWNLRDRKWEMWAEGKQKEKPTKDEITKALKAEGYKAVHIDVSWDTMMRLWQWSCDIEKI